MHVHACIYMYVEYGGFKMHSVNEDELKFKANTVIQLLAYEY